MGALASGIAGLIFGLGLLISGMANPAKVQTFSISSVRSIQA